MDFHTAAWESDASWGWNVAGPLRRACGMLVSRWPDCKETCVLPVSLLSNFHSINLIRTKCQTKRLTREIGDLRVTNFAGTKLRDRQLAEPNWPCYSL